MRNCGGLAFADDMGGGVGTFRSQNGFAVKILQSVILCFGFLFKK